MSVDHLANIDGTSGIKGLYNSSLNSKELEKLGQMILEDGKTIDTSDSFISLFDIDEQAEILGEVISK